MTTSHHKTTQQQSHVPLFSPASIQAKHVQKQQAELIIGGRILVLICLLALWQLTSSIVNPLFISSPLAVAQQLGSWIKDGTLWFNTAITLQETLLGLFFGVVSGILAAFLLGIQPVLAKIFDPFVVALYSIPKVALAPLFILWFGIELQMKVIFAAIIVFFLVFFNALAGIRNVDQDLVNAVRLMGGKPRDIIFKVIVPSTTGHILTGLRIAIPYALIGAVIAELIASNRGLGYLIYSSETAFNTPGVFAAILVLTIIAGLLNIAVNLIDHKTSRWKTGMSMDGRVIP